MSCSVIAQCNISKQIPAISDFARVVFANKNTYECAFGFVIAVSSTLVKDAFQWSTFDVTK